MRISGLRSPGYDQGEGVNGHGLGPPVGDEVVVDIEQLAGALVAPGTKHRDVRGAEAKARGDVLAGEACVHEANRNHVAHPEVVFVEDGQQLRSPADADLPVGLEALQGPRSRHPRKLFSYSFAHPFRVPSGATNFNDSRDILETANYLLNMVVDPLLPEV